MGDTYKVFDEIRMLRETQKTIDTLDQEFRLNSFEHALDKALESAMPQEKTIEHLRKILNKNNEEKKQCLKDLPM